MFRTCQRMKGETLHTLVALYARSDSIPVSPEIYKWSLLPIVNSRLIAFFNSLFVYRNLGNTSPVHMPSPELQFSNQHINNNTKYINIISNTNICHKTTHTLFSKFLNPQINNINTTNYHLVLAIIS